MNFDMPFDPAKAKALAMLKRKGETLKPAEKNLVRSKDKVNTPEFREKVRKRLRDSDSTQDENDPKKLRAKDGSITPRQSLLGTVDLNDEKLKEMLEKKSNHSKLLDAEEEVAMEKYYLKLEKKEMLEEQMASVKEVPVKAVICVICKYKSIVQSQFCKDQNHSVKFVQAFKRFFECSGCKQRTVSLDKMPQKNCSNCESRSWRRVAMGKAKKGPTMDNEVLSLRGNEQSNYGRWGSEGLLTLGMRRIHCYCCMNVLLVLSIFYLLFCRIQLVISLVVNRYYYFK